MRKISQFGLLALLALTIAIGLRPAAAQAADQGARIMLVLDASGSMWGKVGNVTKIEAARRMVGTFLKGWPAGDQLGLIAYGHRRKGDCGDIEIIKPVGPVDPQAFMAQVGSLTPKGRTPMTEAVRVAAEALKSQEGRATVVLVSDGVETCNADPCEVAASLKKADVDLVVNTVGFDIKDPEATRQLRCMADATGGVYLQADDAEGLTHAVQKAVDHAQNQAPPPAPAPAPKAEAKPEWNLTGYARLAAGDDPLTGDVRWELARPAPEGVTAEAIATSYDADIHLMVEPGDYILTLTADQASTQVPITIKAGQMNRADVTLNAGRLGMRAKRTATENANDNTTWTISTKGSDQELFTRYDAESAVIVPAGEYKVSLKIGTSIVSRDVEITPGETTPVEIVAGVGKLKGKVTFTPGGSLVKGPYVEILAGAEPVDGETGIIDSYDGEPVFDIAEGTYRVHIKVDGVERTFPISIKAGETVTQSFPLDAGLAVLSSPGADSVSINEATADIYGEPKEITRFYSVQGSYVLPTGKFSATSRKGEASVTQEFEIKPGARTEVNLPLPK